MRWIAAVVWLGMALAQSLSLPPEALVGQPLEVRGEGFPPGRYTLQISSQAASFAVDLQSLEGRIAATWTPPSPGLYTLRIQVGAQVVQAQTQVRSLPQPVATLTPEGLVLGSWKLPLPGTWVGPKQVGSRIFIARGPLVLEIDAQNPRVVAQHYPPGEVRALEADAGLSVLLEDGRRLALADFDRKPYEGSWEGLGVFPAYQEALGAEASTLDQSPPSPRPYWYYFSQEPARLRPEDLEAAGRDLLQRGHRPELAWGSGVLRWLAPWLEQIRIARSQGLEKSLAWSDFFLKYLPQVPGAVALLEEQADWLEAQGRPDLSQRYREALRQVASWQNPFSSGSLAIATWVLLGLYAWMLLYLNLIYLPAQLRGVRQSGGWLAGWLGHPLLRLRHSMLAYTTGGERTLLLLLLLLVILALLGWGFLLRAEALLQQDSLARGTLRSSAAQETLRSLANTPALRGLLAYAQAQENPGEAQRLYAEAPPWTYVLVGRGTPEALAQAYQQAPSSAAVREALGLGGDLWTPVYQAAGLAREAVPTPRDLTAALMLDSLRELGADFLEQWRSLPIWPSSWWAWLSLALLLLLALYHLLCFFLPRPKDGHTHRAWRRWVQLFFPGSPTYSQGWGLLVLLALGVGGWLGWQGSGWGLPLVGLALAVHLGLWFMLVYRGR
ncbi:hypothetical protein [Meiothermus rufus]|uniref:hypothetical protein n=1 Tax=Meiothermus rufus TaxID=604332 RepID=UPI0004189591|nr:hypothetical protein [Meiothermus rufus]